MGQTTYVERSIPQISLHDFDARIDTITAQLVSAAEKVGFFSITDHGISNQEIESMFTTSASFFSLPDTVKSTVPWTPKNVGWEKQGQIRPSTGAADQKESYQLQFGSNMTDAWISEDVLPEFKRDSIKFMNHVQSVSEKLMLCFARGLGFADDYFINAHDVSRPNCQTCCRLLHYFGVDKDKSNQNPPTPQYRAGAHADWDLLTLLFQKPGQSGLEICPGRDSVTDFGIGDSWTKVDLGAGDIICNIGDLLMSWSDDRFKSTFHRVKYPEEEGDWWGERYSIAFFNQPCSDAVIQGREGKYERVTGEEFNRRAMERNFRALKEKREEMERGRLERGIDEVPKGVVVQAATA